MIRMIDMVLALKILEEQNLTTFTMQERQARTLNLKFHQVWTLSAFSKTLRSLIKQLQLAGLLQRDFD